MSSGENRIVSTSDYEKLTGMAKSQACFRADELLKTLQSVKVLPDHLVPENIVKMNTKVLVQDLDNMSRKKMTLVFPEKADPDRAQLPVNTPLGVKLLGLTEGQSFEYELNDGSKKYLAVRSILYQPEPAD